MAIAMTPVNFYAQQGNGEVLLSWMLVSGATSYQVQRSSDGINYSNLAVATTNNYLDTTALICVQYYYQVASINASGMSTFTSPQGIIATDAGFMCLQQIRFLARAAADQLGSNYRTDPTWNTYINQSATGLYDLITDTFEDYYIVPQSLMLVADSLTTVNGQIVSYPLPSGNNYVGAFTSGVPAQPFYKLRGVDLSFGASYSGFLTMRKFQFINRNEFTWANLAGSFPWASNVKYRVLGNRIYFIPFPPLSQSLFIWYIPRLPQLLQETDVLDGISGWTEYVILDAAIKVLRDQTLDASLLIEQKGEIVKRIEDSAQSRDVGEPDRISQTRCFTGTENGMGQGLFGGGVGF